MKYSADQWVKCRWRIDNVPIDKKVLDEYPELNDIFKPIVKAYKEAANEVSIPLDILVRYVVLVYHRRSPYAANEINIIKRKIEVCEAIGLNVEKEEVKKLIANQLHIVSIAAVHFLKQENSLDWFELQVLSETFYQTMFTLLDNSADVGNKTGIEIAEKKNKVVQQFKATKNDIQLLSDKIFSNDVDLLNQVERYKKAEEENFVLVFPEDYIRSKKTNE